MKEKKKTVYNSCTSQTVNASQDLSCASILIHKTVHSDKATNRYTSATVNILIYIYMYPSMSVFIRGHCYFSHSLPCKCKEQ